MTEIRDEYRLMVPGQHPCKLWMQMAAKKVQIGFMGQLLDLESTIPFRVPDGHAQRLFRAILGDQLTVQLIRKKEKKKNTPVQL